VLQEESFRYVIDSADENIVFMAHPGDLTGGRGGQERQEHHHVRRGQPRPDR
jgi:hypothetical protein